MEKFAFAMVGFCECLGFVFPSYLTKKTNLAYQPLVEMLDLKLDFVECFCLCPMMRTLILYFVDFPNCFISHVDILMEAGSGTQT